MKRRRAPVRRSGGGFVIALDGDETALVLRLLGELRQLLIEQPAEGFAGDLIVRLFPVVHPDDEQAEAEYQRFMRDDLVQSKLAAIASVEDLLEGDGPSDVLAESQVIAFMQSVNSLRLVLGTMLGVSDDPEIGEVADDMEDSPEYHLYAYLSWLLEYSVRALSGD